MRSGACVPGGEIRWRGQLVYLNCALAGEPVGLAENTHGWTVSFGPVDLPRSIVWRRPWSSPNPPAVDLWTTLRVATILMATNSSSRPERNKELSPMSSDGQIGLPMFPVAQRPAHAAEGASNSVRYFGVSAALMFLIRFPFAPCRPGRRQRVADFKKEFFQPRRHGEAQHVQRWLLIRWTAGGRSAQSTTL